MNNTPTPETDAQQKYFNSLPLKWSSELSSCYTFARKLERERDEARKTCVEIDLSHRKLESERDQLRKVCDELANAVLDSEYKVALTNYTQLPHVQERNKNFR